MNTDSPTVYEWTGPTGVKFTQAKEPSGVYYHSDTPRDLIDALENARANHYRVRLFLGSGVTGKEWYEEDDVCGTLSNSTGPIKVPILLSNSRSMGGGAILDNCIVRLFVNGWEVWCHPKWKPSKFTIHEIGPTVHVGKVNLRAAGYTHAVNINGRNHANFKSLKKAQRWIAFMKGERMSK